MLDFLTTPRFPNAALGIEHNAISAVRLRREGRGAYGIDRASTIALPKTQLGQASYTIDVRLISRVNPGRVLQLASPPLARA